MITRAPTRPHFLNSPRPSSQIEQQARKRLENASYLALRYLHCSCHGGVVTIHGRLPSYYLKQVAQTVVSQVDGVCRVDNRVEVA